MFGARAACLSLQPEIRINPGPYARSSSNLWMTRAPVGTNGSVPIVPWRIALVLAMPVNGCGRRWLPQAVMDRVPWVAHSIAAACIRPLALC